MFFFSKIVFFIDLVTNLVCFPPPHEAEHGEKTDQSPQPPSKETIH